MKEQRNVRQFIVQCLGLAAIMVASLAGYLVVLKVRGPAALFETYVAWDDAIPFNAAWVWVYLIPYIVGPIVVGLLRRSTFRWYVCRGLVVVGCTLLIFIVFPNKVRDRDIQAMQALYARDDVTARLYIRMAEVDEPPANAAPSLHVSLTFLLALAVMIDFPRWWPAAVLCVGAVWFATLATRQHHLVDVATGALLAQAVVYLWPRPKQNAIRNA